MAEITLKADTGRRPGSAASRRLRAAGKVPGTVYGLGGAAVSVAVEWRELRGVLTTDAGLNALIDLDVDGDHQLTIVKELQRHPVRRAVLHVDFLRVSRDQPIDVEVPIVLVGEAEAVLRDGGRVEQAMHALPISAKPADIPNDITVDVTELGLGDSIRVGDLPLPAGVTTSVDAEEPVVVGLVAQAMEIPEPGEGEEEEGEAAAAEGEAGEEASAGGDAGEGGEGGGE